MRMRVSLIAVAMGMTCVPALGEVAAADETEVAELRSQVAEMRQEIDALRTQNGETWLTEQRAKEVRALVQDVLNDADTRASLADSGMTAGWDNGFFLGSADGKFKLKIAGQLQFRFVYNHQQDSPTDDNRHGFETRRAKVFFSGHVFDPTWEYYLEIQNNRNTGNMELGEDAWVQKDLGSGFAVRFGQYKPRYLREETISSRRLETVERSLVNSQFTTGTAQGVQLSYKQDRWRAFGSYIDGRNSGNTPWDAEDTDYAFTVRAEGIPFGDWADVDDDVPFPGTKTSLLLGGGVFFQGAEHGTGNNLPPPDFNNNEVRQFGATVDATLKFDRFSIVGAFIYAHPTTKVPGGSDVELDQYAFVVRGGFFVTDDIELYATYQYGDLDTSGVSDLSVVTLGVGKFFNKHALKWQTDIGYGINPVNAPWAQASAGWRPDAPGEDGQIVVRSQFQLLF